MTDVQSTPVLADSAASSPAILSTEPSNPTASTATAVPSSTDSPSSATSSASAPLPLAPLPSALYDAIYPALSHCDQAIDAVFTSQSQLASHIDTLATLLTALHTTTQQQQQNNTTAQPPTLFAPYITKLQSAKRRIKRLQTTVDRINTRLNDTRDIVRRKEGINMPTAANTTTTGRLSLSSIASMAQQALTAGGGGSAEKGEVVVRSAEQVKAKAGEGGEQKQEDDGVGEVSEIESIQTLAPVLDKSAAAHTTYGSVPTSAPSPTAASTATATVTATASSVAPAHSDTTNGATAALPTSLASSSSAPSSTVLLHDLLAWDGQ